MAAENVRYDGKWPSRDQGIREGEQTCQNWQLSKALDSYKEGRAGAGMPSESRAGKGVWAMGRMERGLGTKMLALKKEPLYMPCFRPCPANTTIMYTWHVALIHCRCPTWIEYD